MARKVGVESDIVLPKDILEKVGHSRPATKKELAALMKDIPWRFQEYGDQIFRITQNFK